MITTEKKKFHDRATRDARKLEKEKSDYGFINDGAGKRYRVGVYFLLAGDVKKSAAAFDWFYDQFPDDIGEPVFNLYAALASYRCGEIKKARKRLLATQLSNLFLLPFLIGQRNTDIAVNLWHSSNHEQESYLLEIEEFLDEPTNAERSWIETELNTQSFMTLKEGYIATFAALKEESDINKRDDILSQWETLQAEEFGNAG